MITMYHSIIKKQILEASVQVISVAQSCPTLCDTMNRSQAYLSITDSRSSLKLMSIESVMPSSHLNLCHPLLLLPSIPPSIRVFSNESTLRMRWPKYWRFSLQHQSFPKTQSWLRLFLHAIPFLLPWEIPAGILTVTVEAFSSLGVEMQKKLWTTP